MGQNDKARVRARRGPAGALPSDGEALLARYGDQLEEEAMSEAAKQEFLLALWQIMQAFVDLGFSVQAGEKFTPESGIGLDDVLQYLIPEDIAHETVAPQSTDDRREAQ